MLTSFGWGLIDLSRYSMGRTVGWLPIAVAQELGVRLTRLPYSGLPLCRDIVSRLTGSHSHSQAFRQGKNYLGLRMVGHPILRGSCVGLIAHCLLSTGR